MMLMHLQYAPYIESALGFSVLIFVVYGVLVRRSLRNIKARLKDDYASSA